LQELVKARWDRLTQALVQDSHWTLQQQEII
jgi:hypothetical protein